MGINPHEQAIIDSFFLSGRRERYFTIRNNKERRAQWLNKLNHSPGLNEKYVHWVDSKVNILVELRKRGAPSTCFVISCSKEIDRREILLEEALLETELLGWGTVIGCIPGVLAYYYGEMSSKRRAILEKPIAKGQPGGVGP